MVGLWVRTPNSLKVEQIKIDICFEFINKIDGNFVLSVCERAIVSIFTPTAITGSTELGPVLIGVVELFDSRVAVDTRISHRTRFLLGDVAAKLRLI